MFVDVALVALSLLPLAWTSYLAGLALLSWRNPIPSPPEPPKTRFDVIVPAHDEEIGIAATVASLLAMDYPAELRRVLVVADNCKDATADRAREAGAVVLERQDTSRRGKGYALEHAFERTLRDGQADAVAIVDADTTVTPNLLKAFADRISRGALAVQAEYGVANRTDSWRTRLMHIALTLFHGVRSSARERLGVSAGLRGNGMAFATPLLRAVPHDAFSIVEDVEYGIRLGFAGHRVEYAGEAQVFGQMVSSEAASRSQRRRWEGGRWALARQHGPKLVATGLRRGRLLLLDLAADLLVPPLTYVALTAGLGFLAALGWWATGRGAWWALAPWAASVAGLMVYILRGVWMSGVGLRAVPDLMWAPVYMAWKILLRLRSSPTKNPEWVRTTREGEKP
ncbi:MAG: glycosyltransferase family 2 protein [Polyangiaceae bacterium]|jgi:GT2 family glycosyltransferase